MKLKDLLTTTIQGLAVGLVGLVVAIGVLSRLGYMQPVLPYVVMSGSMEPALPVGSVVLVSSKPFGYAVGNIITFKTTKKGDAVTHRITGLVEDAEGLAYQTKGDANEEVDFALVRPKQVIGEVVYMIPYLGSVAQFAKQPQGFIALVVIPATVIVWEELKSVMSELNKGVRQVTAKAKKRRTLPAGFKVANFVPSTAALSAASPRNVSKSMTGYNRSFVVVPVLIALSAMVTLGTASYFSDNEVSLGNVLGAASNFAQLDNSEPATEPLGPATDSFTNQEQSLLPEPTPFILAHDEASPGASLDSQ